MEIAAVRAVVAGGLPVRPWPHLKAGDRVRVERGPLHGVEGTLLREEKLQLGIGVEILQRSLAVEIEPNMVTPVP